MIKDNGSTQIERDCDYEEFERLVKENFETMVKKETPLFTTEVSGLWDTYLNNLPEKHRQHYNCNGCKHFIRRFGNLVTIDNKGKIKSVLWGIEVPEFFSESVKEMKKVVESASIRGVFISDNRVLGIHKTGEWSHISAKLPMGKINTSRLKDASQVIAEKLENFGMVNRALEEYSIETVNTAIELLKTEALYRGDKCLGVAEWFGDLQIILSHTKNEKIKTNLKWLAVEQAPDGFCHIRSSMIGTLLDDIQDGLSMNVVARRFADKMSPQNYMRSQSAPTEGAIQQAEKIVEKLGIENSLLRRYATIDEIPLIWMDKSKNLVREPKTSGVFGNVVAKEKQPMFMPDVTLPTTVMTWDKFSRTVLQTADKVEARISDPSRLMAIVTAQDETSENILQWNNLFSWYYHSGIDGEMKRRIENAGGKHEGNEIRCSLMWDNYTDLDLHCITPSGREIYFGNKQQDGGYLDIDMNVCNHDSNTPVENIRFEKNAPEGIYIFKVDNYTDRNRSNNPYKVELEVNGQIFTFCAIANSSYNEVVFKFRYQDGKVEMLSNGVAKSNSLKDWNLSDGGFIKVNGITTSPNLWEENKGNSSGSHIFFLLDGCKDLSEGKGRGFFNEMLKPELREIRKTLEAYVSSATIENVDEATACGIGFSSESEWNFTLKVTSNNTVRYIKIDRWD